jgi:nitroimidazol reductase NimA-like FMN-containing flavoprotein (pyridoxamine 5'-phosphate oxidase superfamily)
LEITMRRKEKEIQNQDDISKVIKKCQVCRLGLSQNNIPYIVPVSFGYDGKVLYFHSAKDGKKIDILSGNNSVCFEFESDVKLVPNESKPCNWSFSFQSVIGFGKAEELVSPEDKIEGINRIMEQYSDKKWDFSQIPLDGLRIWKIKIENITGKQSMDHVEQ